MKFHNEYTQTLNINEKSIRQKIIDLIILEGKMEGEISIIFCTDDYLLKINKDFLNHDYYTDIITFNYVSGNIISGDLFISIERVKENAKFFNVKFIEELERVILHGILHLIGYDDKTTEQKEEIRKKENYYLRRLKAD
ncbi:MAG: rRNA maturation RNase YbeY [Chlorobi bacterium]|nr:rRNA maturation RNase YbeY [Chlorobiota bacterium]